MREEESANLDDAIWALVFFGIGSLLFMNRTTGNAPYVIFAGAMAFIFACFFVARLLIKPRR